MKKIAYFLPGYHEDDLNNRWWGKGFTEWDNLRDCKPLFKGHKPATKPKDGYYDLLDSETLKRQVKKIKAAGIDGISIYDYWSDGIRPLGRFIDRFLKEPSLDLEFNICWANHAWTRSWKNKAGSLDILLDQKDHIPTKMLRKKILKVGTGPLKIVYAGRANPMKGPLDWVEVLEKLDARGVDFHATWLGDGPLLDAMKAKIKAAGLGGKVTMSGFVSDRQYVLDVLRDAHIHMFCHKTPESPRNLIEALISGTPIVGYDGAYARDLVHGHRGGEFVSIGETDALADQVEAIANDRANLAQLMEDAYNDGKIFSSDAVFKHRSDLIKEFLPGPAKEMAPLHA